MNKFERVFQDIQTVLSHIKKYADVMYNEGGV